MQRKKKKWKINEFLEKFYSDISRISFYLYLVFVGPSAHEADG